jgi:hypothetical protein
MDKTCLALTGEEELPCGKPATAEITVRNKVTSAKVPVCARHKASHDRGFAKLRTQPTPR